MDNRRTGSLSLRHLPCCSMWIENPVHDSGVEKPTTNDWREAAQAHFCADDEVITVASILL
jgi:hypothetical protein